jgi:D-alanyl-D-alanine carboxypeptidase
MNLSLPPTEAPAPSRPDCRGRGYAAVTLSAVALMLVVAGCSSANRTSAPTTTVTPTSSGTPTTSQPGGARSALLNRILDAHHYAGEFVGARVALRDTNGTVTEATAGTQTIDPASAPVDAHVPWGIGSNTKTFVAVVVLQLAAEGRINLDAGIEAYLPHLAGAAQITPRELLQHTSGLNEYLDKPAVLNDPHRVWTPSELIAVAEAAGRVGKPGGPYHYSNTNYIVLGEIIKQVTGNSWFDEVRTRILEPLGMSSTSLIGAQEAPGYNLVNDKFVDATYSLNPSLGGAAGGLQSTDHDVLLFAAALAKGTLLSPKMRQAMQTFVPGEDLSQFGVVHSYGLGLERYSNQAITVYGHLGISAAHSSFFGYDTKHGTAVAVMMNSTNPGPQAVMAIETLTAASQTG